MRHHLDGPRRQQAHAVELAAVEQHLREPQVVVGRTPEAAAAGRSGRHLGAGLTHVESLEPAVVAPRRR